MNSPAPSTVPDTPLATLSSSGVRDSSGKQGTLGRPGEPDRARRDRGRNVDDEGWQPEDHARPGGAERERLDEVAGRQRMGSLRSVGDQRRERRAQGGRDQLGDRNQPERRRPRRLVGVQEDGDPGPEFRGVEQEEGELDATQRRTLDDGSDDPQRGEQVSQRASSRRWDGTFRSVGTRRGLRCAHDRDRRRDAHVPPLHRRGVVRFHLRRDLREPQPGRHARRRRAVPAGDRGRRRRWRSRRPRPPTRCGAGPRRPSAARSCTPSAR